MKQELADIIKNMSVVEFTEFCEEIGADMYKVAKAISKKYYYINTNHGLVGAIKIVRSATRLGLKEAKDLVEAHRISETSFGPFEFEITTEHLGPRDCVTVK